MKKKSYGKWMSLLASFTLLCGCSGNQPARSEESQNKVENTENSILEEELVSNEEVEMVEVSNEEEGEETSLTQKNEVEGEEAKSESAEEVVETPSVDTSEVEENDTKVEEPKVELVPASSSTLSNTTCAWGFVRKKEDKKPEFYGPHAKILDAYQGIYCDKTEEKIIYLTFDEGYENGYTSTILDTLKEKNVTATFFVTMPYVKQQPELVKRMIEEGHIVGNHTVNHPSMPSITDDEKLKKEIMDLHDYVKENFNYEMTYLRPPKGEYSERTVKLALDLGYRTVLWSAAYDDWDTKKQDRLDYARGMILNYLHPGEVMLLHAVSKDNDALLGEVIDEARNRGYTFVSLD